MEDPMETCEFLDIDTIRSRVKDLGKLVLRDEAEEPHVSDPEGVLLDCALQFETKVNHIVEEFSDVDLLGNEDSDAYLECLKKELSTVEAESAKISEEIELLSKTHAKDSTKLDRDLEGLLMSLDSVASQVLDKANKGAPASGLAHEDQLNLINQSRVENFEIMELESQIEENKTILKSLQDLETECKRFGAIEQIEDALTNLKVIEYEGNTIRLSLQTHIPKLAGLFDQHKVEDIDKASEPNHELLIEIMDRTMEVKNVEMFPNDVYIQDIVEATKSFRQISLQSTLLDIRSPLQWFVGKVQERIILSTLRRLMVRSAKTFRHTFEYFDRDETIVAHLVGGVDAFIKVSQGWPILNTPLKLASIKNSDHCSKGVSLNLICKVEELANSLNSQIRQNLSSFVDAVEKIIMEQIHFELHSTESIEK